MMNNLRDEIERIRGQSNIHDLVSIDTQLMKQGKGYAGRCPFPGHEDKDPSFHVNEEKQYCYCFGCHRGGDIFKYVMHRDNIHFTAAVGIVAKELNIPPPSLEKKDLREIEDEYRIKDILSATTRFYHQNLTEDTTAYLEARIIVEKTIKRHLIGYASGGLREHLINERHFPQDLCLKAGVLKETEGGSIRDYFYKRIVFPVFRHGEVIFFTGRSLDDRDPKYLHLPGEKPLYNEDALSNKEVFVTEGPFDCLALEQNGYPAIATLGTSLKPESLPKFSRCERIYLCFDGDEAGMAATRKIGSLIGERGRIAQLPEGEDANSYFQKHSMADFQALVDKAVDIITYELNLIPPNTPKIELPDTLDSIMKILATMNKAKAHAHLKHTIKNYFNLTGPEIKDYEDIEKKYRDEVFDQKSRGSESEDGPFTTDKVLEILKNQKNITLIQPAQDYVNGIMNFTVKVGKELCLLTSDRKVYRLQEIQQAGFEIEHNMVTMTKFSPKGISRFLEDKGIDVDIPRLFHRLYDYINRFIYFKDRTYSKLLALWIMGTYIYRVFYCYPYLWIKAGQGSGKTLLMEILFPIAFNGALITYPSESYIFREVAYDQVSMFIDEVESLRNEDRNKYGAIMSILNTGYRKSGTVPRTEKDEKGQFIPKRFCTYSPKMFAGINKINSTTQDRTIRINILKKKENEKVEEYMAGPIIEELQRSLRDDLYIYAFLHGHGIAKIYNDEQYRPEEMDHLINREREIWKPIFIQSHVVDSLSRETDRPTDLVGEMEVLSRALLKEKLFDISQQDKTCELLKVFRSCAEEHEPVPIDKQTGRYFLDYEKVFDFFKNTEEFAWLKTKNKTAKTLTNMLGSIKVKSEQIALVQGSPKVREYTFHPADVLDLYERYLGERWDDPPWS